MMFQTGSPGLARRALDALLDPCAVLRPVRDEDGVVTDFVWLDANAAAVEYSGLEYEEFIGLGMVALLPGRDMQALFEEYVRAVEDGTAVDKLDVEFVADGHAAPYTRFDLHAVPIGGDLFVSWHDSSERREQADALAKSERRFRILAEHASDVVLETAPDGSIVWVSPTLHDVLGFEREAWLGRKPRDLVIPDDVDGIVAMGRDVQRRGESNGAVDFRFVASTGELRWMSVRARLIRDEGTVTGAVLGLRDIQAAVLQHRAVTTLRSANAILARTLDEDDLLHAMCEVAVDHSGYLFAWYGRAVQDEEKSVVAVASSRAHRDYLDVARITWSDGPLGRGPAGTCLRTGELQIVDDFPSDRSFRPWRDAAEQHGFRSSLCLPVFVGDRLDGVFSLYAAESRAFDAQAVSVMKEVAVQLGYGIERIRDAERLERALSEQRLLHTAIDQAAEAIVVTDLAGLIRYVNPAALKSSGYELEEVLGRNPRLFQSGLHDRRFYADMWNRLRGGQPWHGVLVNRRKDGEFYEEDATIAPVHDQSGKRIAFVAVKHDLSRERSLEAVVNREALDRDAIVSVMRDVRTGDSLEATAASLCAAVQGLDQIAGALVVLLMEDGTALPIARAGAPMPAELGTMVELSKAGPWWMEFQDRDGVTSLDAGFTASAHAPMRWEGEVIGVLSVATKAVDAGQWMPLRLGVLTEVASFAAMLLGPQAAQHGRREAQRAEIADIIEHERFHVIFEPVVHLPTGIPVGFEALTRFDDGQRPDTRFAVAHGVGLGTELEAACAAVALREAVQLPADVWVSVNFSPTSIVEGRAAAVVRSSIRRVIIEITEHNAIENYAAVRWGIEQCGDVLVAVDDAGAGFASLRHILELQPDIIKLDLALVRDIDVDPARQALAAGLRHFAVLTGTTLVAEGVETEAEAAAIQELGVELAQGYLFDAPVRVAG
ncbi:MAG: hypothetical protein RJA49_2891 [Actinomycetota bacterium]